jgi:hypothetical protein
MSGAPGISPSETRVAASARVVRPLYLLRLLDIPARQTGAPLTDVYLCQQAREKKGEDGKTIQAWPKEAYRWYDRFGGMTDYVPLAFAWDKAASDNSDGNNSMRITIDETTRGIIGLGMQASWPGTLVQLILVYLDEQMQIASPGRIIFSGLIETCVVSESVIDIEVLAGLPRINQAPAWQHWDKCRWQYKGIHCGYTGEEASCDKCYRTCKARGNGERFGGFPYIDTGRDVRDPFIGDDTRFS